MFLENTLHGIGQLLGYTWWLILYFFLWPLFRQTWRFWREEIFFHGPKWQGVLLELKVPREVIRGPQAMEQVLAALHRLRNGPGNVEEWWIDGEYTRWFTFEMVSIGGEVHLYVRVPYKKIRHMVEAYFYAFYSDIELIEVEDYMNRIPASIPEMYAQGYNLWGCEVNLTQPDAYPTKTYHDFESPQEEKEYDPIAATIELLAKVKREEIMGIQILAAPADDLWAKHYDHLVEKLRLREQQNGGHRGGGGMMAGLTMQGMLPARAEGHEEKQSFQFIMRTPGETDVLKAVETNLSKPAFETIIRVIYLSPEPLFMDSFPRYGIRSILNQYAANDLNSFVINKKTIAQSQVWIYPYVFPNTRDQYRKARLLYNYRRRLMPPESWIGKYITSTFFSPNFASKPFHLTSQCLATLFHPPTMSVLTGPHMQKSPSRKVGPPAGLAIFGEETEIERFK